MEYYLGVARDKQIPEEKIGAVQAIVMAVSAGKVNEQIKEVRRKMDAPEGK
jgi:hypothetical protein